MAVKIDHRPPSVQDLMMDQLEELLIRCVDGSAYDQIQKLKEENPLAAQVTRIQAITGLRQSSSKIPAGSTIYSAAATIVSLPEIDRPNAINEFLASV